MTDVLEILLQVAPAHPEQRPHDFARNFPVVVLDEDSGMNSAEPPQSCPANHPHEHSFRLIVERVPGHDLGQSSTAEELCLMDPDSIVGGCPFRARTRAVEERPFRAAKRRLLVIGL